MSLTKTVIKHLTQTSLLILILTSLIGCGSSSGVDPVPAGGASKKIFITATDYSGNLGGVAGADASCMADASYPGTGTYKALIVDGTDRIATVTANTGDGQIDWVLQPNTDYVQSDGTTPIMTTDANGLFVFGTLTNTLSSSGTSGIWTGLTADWQTGLHCVNWTSDSVADFGYHGLQDRTDSEAIFSGATTYQCIPFNSFWLACVEQ